MIKITLPDKSIKEFESDIDGQEIAKSISNSLAKSAVCIDVNGELKDLSYVITEDSKCKIYTKQDQYALDTLRHSTAHVLAQAVLNLFPGTEFAVGPSIEDGFYYDFLFKENMNFFKMLGLTSCLIGVLIIIVKGDYLALILSLIHI